jgi:hypothetical protein
MSDSSAKPPVAEYPQGVERRSMVPRSWVVGSVVAAIMVMLALFGVGLTTTSSEFAPKYWMSLVPVFGVLCIGTAWARTRHSPGGARPEVIRQVFHWFGIAVAVFIDFMIRATGQDSGTAAGLNALLLLALGCYLAGVHLDWLFVGVGLLLTLTLYFVVKAEQYVWILFVVGGIAIVALIGSRWLIHKWSRPKSS